MYCTSENSRNGAESDLGRLLERLCPAFSSLSNRRWKVCRDPKESPCARHRLGSAIFRHLMRCTATRQQALHRMRDGRMQRLAEQVASAHPQSPCARHRMGSAIFRHLTRCTATWQQAQTPQVGERISAAACACTLAEDFCCGFLWRGGGGFILAP